MSSFTTPALEMTNKPVKVVEAGKAVVAAQTNISDYETNVGFQWRKYDAPSSLPNSEGAAALYEGTMEGFIKNLQPSSYYNVRAFYRANDGTEYTTAWQTFDPSDFSYFEPTVKTYDATQVKHNTAALRAYCMRGSDEHSEQGFEYAPVHGMSAQAVTMPADPLKVVCEGQVMECTLKNLEPESEYAYRAYAVAGGKTYYGETRTFTTAADPSDGVQDVISGQGQEALVIGTYNLYGIPVGEDARGLVIEVLSNGKSRKILRR